ncbi:MAG: hypothetical protein O7C74_02880, partial [Acidobacteria bacterium]|nr:hypothetical protein [Acidobacteriota bacterium]
ATLDELPPVEEFGDVMGDGSSEHLVAALDRLPGGDAGAILPLEDETGGQAGDAGAAPLEPPSTPTDGAGANGAGESS